MFTSESGNAVRFRDHTGSNPPSYRIGDRVLVLYLAHDSQSAMIDRGVWNWVAPVLVVLVGTLLIAFGVLAWRQSDPST
jgi:hypothetical protein